MINPLFDPKSFLSHTTRKPGVYRMLGSGEEVLYIGKAKNLKSRLSSYFRTHGITPKTNTLVSKITRIEVTVTRSETEALLLEQTLIKNEKPPYNVLFRDDKSYPYIYLSDHEDYPQLTFERGKKNETGRYFGPFPSSSAVRDSLSLLQKLFQLRTCDDVFFKNRSRPCLQYQIERCSGPCAGKIDAIDYNRLVGLASLFLDGKNDNVIASFKTFMTEASDNLDFERAAKYRDQVAHLRRIQEKQYVYGSGGDVDLFAVSERPGVQCIQALFVRDGRVLGQKTWFPKNQLELPVSELMEAFLSQFYLGGKDRDIPPSVIISEPIENSTALCSAIISVAGKKIVIANRVRGQRAQWLKLAQENCEAAIALHWVNKQSMYSRFIALQDALDLESVPERIECFDVSHTMGEATVASCVVFDVNGPVKSDYRRFNITLDVKAGDDYGAMEEAIRRRFTRLKKGEGRIPDILLIDGGYGQMMKARKVLNELQVDHLTILGVVKGQNRNARNDEILIETGDLKGLIKSEAKHLLQQARDEAHRFAIAGHRARRAKNRKGSILDSIPGIGPKRKRELIAHFGSIREIKGASSEEISRVPGISKHIADSIYERLHPD